MTKIVLSSEAMSGAFCPYRESRNGVRVVALGILVSINHSQYGTPILRVLKENGKLRIAGNFSVTLNKDLVIDKYLFPRIEVFAKLDGGKHYSKIDLKNINNLG